MKSIIFIIYTLIREHLLHNLLSRFSIGKGAKTLAPNKSFKDYQLHLLKYKQVISMKIYSMRFVKLSIQFIEQRISQNKFALFNQINVHRKISTIFTNSKNGKTSHTYRLVLNLIDKMDL